MSTTGGRRYTPLAALLLLLMVPAPALGDEPAEPKAPVDRLALSHPANTIIINPFGMASRGWLLEGLRVAYERTLIRPFSLAITVAVRFPLLEDHYGVLYGVEGLGWFVKTEYFGVFLGMSTQIGQIYSNEVSEPVTGMAMFANAGVRLFGPFRMSLTLGGGLGMWFTLHEPSEVAHEFPTNGKMRLIMDIGWGF